MTNTEITRLCDQAMSAYDAGDFREALLQFERLCSLGRDDVRAWYMQGMASRGLGDRDHVVKCMEHVLRLDPEYVDAYLCLAEMLQAQGRLTEAAGNLHRVLELDPENPAVRPSLAAAYGSMASDCRARSDWAGAEELYRKALQYMPSMPALHFNLGLVLQAQGMYTAAIESLRAVLGLDPHHVACAMALSQLLQQHGEYAESLRYCLVALQQGASDMSALQYFIKVLNMQRDVQPMQAAHHWIERCLDAGGIDWQRLSRPVTVILNSDPEVVELITLLRDGQVAALQDRLTGEQPPGVLHESLFNRALTRFLFCDPDIELLLGGLRRTFLAVVSNVPAAEVRSGIVDDDGRFLAALACQCFTSEYSYALDDESAGRIRALEVGLAADFAAGRWDAQRDIARVCVYAMYRPLHRLPGVEWLFADGCRLRGDIFTAFLEIQWYGPQREFEIRSRIPDITDIEDTVSHQVRAMYEASPYPPWLSVARHVPRPFGQVVRQMFPAVVAPKTEGDHVDLLVAGCGTGKQAIMSASRYINSRVLAVDLSLSSLAYAQRKADELGADNIRFARADILKLASLPDRFHVIESVGVLHHMAQPQQGLDVLTGLLHGNGLLQVGLYSARARRYITQLQTHFREAGFTSAPDDIRRARQEILVSDNEACRRVKRVADIYSISGCRDLLFHVQERLYTLADIASLLEQAGLRFLGFGWGNPRAPTRYRQLYPDDPAMTDLARWDEFEQRYPDTFLGMYVCWCQKI